MRAAAGALRRERLAGEERAQGMARLEAELAAARKRVRYRQSNPTTYLVKLSWLAGGERAGCAARLKAELANHLRVHALPDCNIRWLAGGSCAQHVSTFEAELAAGHKRAHALSGCSPTLNSSY